MTRSIQGMALALAFPASLALAAAPDDVAAGRALYAVRCAACHSIEYNGVGPAHKNLIGRRAGTAQGYSYSSALKNANVVWGEDTLSRWLADPEKFIPGQKMSISIPDARDRAQIVAYLLAAGRPQAAAPSTPTGDHQ